MCVIVCSVYTHDVLYVHRHIQYCPSNAVHGVRQNIKLPCVVRLSIRPFVDKIVTDIVAAAAVAAAAADDDDDGNDDDDAIAACLH